MNFGHKKNYFSCTMGFAISGVDGTNEIHCWRGEQEHDDSHVTERTVFHYGCPVVFNAVLLTWNIHVCGTKLPALSMHAVPLTLRRA